MSLDTWIEEFYTPVEKAKEWTDKQCFEHTLTKYQGLIDKNLKKHGVTLNRGMLGTDPEKVFIGTNTCSLCIKYYEGMGNDNEDYPREDCRQCPLDKAGHGCFNQLETGKEYDPSNLWEVMYVTNNPSPMIKQMKKMIKQCDKTGKWEE
jgi:hypothetical protein